jgi:predicted nucleotide-binding protein (sugar kinase/HSP70/actin superfamily)
MCDPTKATEKTRKRKLKKILVYAKATYTIKPKINKNISVKLRRTNPNKIYIFKSLPLLNAKRKIFTFASNILFLSRVKAISFFNFR